MLGVTQLSQPGFSYQRHTIRSLVRHQHYDGRNNFHDIAMIELQEPVNCSDYIQPACLPDKRVRISALTQCYISGWGITDVKSESPKIRPPPQEQRGRAPAQW